MVKGQTTTHIRVDKDTVRKLRLALPSMSDNKRITLLYDTSAVKLEKALQDADFLNKMGTFIYGKAWKKQKR